MTNDFYLNEIRVYQVPNLLQELTSVGITSDTSPSSYANRSATNLITNLNNRSSNDWVPIFAIDKGLGSYRSCYIVSESEISSAGHIFKLGIDLGDIYFQHAILII